MPHYRISEAAGLLGVSDDTVRRWVDDGRLGSTADAAGRKVVDGAALARHAQDLAGRTASPARDDGVGRSARNRFTGLVTRVVADGVMAQVELQCGPYRVVSLMSSEAAEELGLEPGSLATAVVKATNVIVETPPAAPARGGLATRNGGLPRGGRTGTGGQA
jgi:molybdopterin-binding protein